MRNIQLLLFIITLLSKSLVAQSNYSSGFDEGYKNGYCYGDAFCSSPIPPITPIPLIGESDDSYQDGYNRGFSVGTKDRQKKNNKISSAKTKENEGTNGEALGYTVKADDYSGKLADYLTQSALLQQQYEHQQREENASTYDRNSNIRNALLKWVQQLIDYVIINSSMNDADKSFVKVMNDHYKDLLSLSYDQLVNGGETTLGIYHDMIIGSIKFYKEQKETNNNQPNSGVETQPEVEWTPVNRAGTDQGTGFTNKMEANNEIINGQKEGKWIEYETSNFFTIPRTDTSAPYYVLSIYKNGYICGISREYYKNGILRSSCPYSDGSQNGVLKAYDENGNLYSETPLIHGEKDGVEKEYYENGKLKCERPYTNDKGNGIDKFYYEDGKLRTEIPCTDGIINGIMKRYYKSGKIKQETYYTNGVAGKIINYDKNGDEIKK